MSLHAERDALVQAESNSYSPDAFPGSRQWMINNQASKALAAFDAAHPEISAELQAKSDAERKASSEAFLAGGFPAN